MSKKKDNTTRNLMIAGIIIALLMRKKKKINTKDIAFASLANERFLRKIVGIANRLKLDPSWLMTIIRIESGKNFLTRKSKFGLIGIQEGTAKRLGTSWDALAKMDSYQSLDYVEKYFRSHGVPDTLPINSLDDLYMLVFWGKSAIGKPDSYVLYSIDDGKIFAQKGSDTYETFRTRDTNQDDVLTIYEANIANDLNKDGIVTKGEIIGTVKRLEILGKSQYAR